MSIQQTTIDNETPEAMAVKEAEANAAAAKESAKSAKASKAAEAVPNDPLLGKQTKEVKDGSIQVLVTLPLPPEAQINNATKAIEFVQVNGIRKRIDCGVPTWVSVPEFMALKAKYPNI